MPVMGKWSRDELEAAFDSYQRTAMQAGMTGDWDSWADMFTEDATYIEHHYGTLGGREAIRRWINETMSTWPGDQMPHFPVEWYIIDEDRGWVVCQVWNRMADPGDGSLHQAYNFTLLKYAGGGKWSYEEDIYNPASFASMVGGWVETQRKVAASRTPPVSRSVGGPRGRRGAARVGLACTSSSSGSSAQLRCRASSVSGRGALDPTGVRHGRRRIGLGAHGRTAPPTASPCPRRRP